jgi:hypothetical protein
MDREHGHSHARRGTAKTYRASHLTSGHIQWSHGARRRAAALYALTLLVSFTVVAAGINVVTLEIDRRRIQGNIASGEQSFLAAQGGIEWARMYADTNPDWRDALLTSGPHSLTIPGMATVQVSVETDPTAVTSTDTDAVDLRVIAESEGARRGVLARALPAPHPAMEYALFSSSTIQFASSSDVVSGPVYAATAITSSGSITIQGNARFDVPPGGVISPFLTPQNTNRAPITKPQPDFSTYLSRATMLQSGALTSDFNINRANLTPTANSISGAVNSSGIYALNMGSRNVRLDRIHLRGTLILYGNGGNRVEIRRPTWIEPGPAGLPVLLIKVPAGVVELKVETGMLRESDPPAVDFNEDGDMSDEFSPSVSGLIWIQASVTKLDTSSWVYKGCVIADTVVVRDGVQVDDDPSIVSRLITGFTDGKLYCLTGSLREVIP